MRIDRFQSYILDVYRSAPGVSAEAWPDSERPRIGVRVSLPNGKTVSHALTYQRFDGEDVSAPEGEPVLGEPPVEVPVPDPGKPAPYLAALIANARSKEMKRVYVYPDDAMHPGLGVTFHNGSRIFMLLV